jgi:YHS domain-containing protein
VSRDVLGSERIVSENADIKDPVCGKPVDPLRARAVGIFGGVTHYFCSAECKARFADPRRAPGGAPPAGERRLQEPSDGPDGAGDWFARGAAPASSAPAGPDRFEDLEAGAAPTQAMPPSPSLLVEVEGVRRRRAWPIVALVLVAVGLVAALLLRS